MISADRTSGSVPAARRALTTLELLARRPEGATLAGLSRDLGIAPSSLLALLSALSALGYVSRGGDRYRIDAAALALGATAAACLSVDAAYHRARERLERSTLAPELQRAIDMAARPAAPQGKGLSGEELESFLRRPLVAVLAYENDAGYPSTVPVWYAAIRDPGDRVVFWLLPGPGARWAEQLQRDPRVSLTVSEDDPPFRRVNAEGLASVVRDARYAAKLRAELVARYAAPEAEPIAKPELVIRIEPTRVLSWRGLTPRSRPERAA